MKLRWVSNSNMGSIFDYQVSPREPKKKRERGSVFDYGSKSTEAAVPKPAPVYGPPAPPSTPRTQGAAFNDTSELMNKVLGPQRQVEGKWVRGTASGRPEPKPKRSGRIDPRVVGHISRQLESMDPKSRTVGTPGGIESEPPRVDEDLLRRMAVAAAEKPQPHIPPTEHNLDPVLNIHAQPDAPPLDPVMQTMKDDIAAADKIEQDKMEAELAQDKLSTPVTFRENVHAAGQGLYSGLTAGLYPSYMERTDPEGYERLLRRTGASNTTAGGMLPASPFGIAQFAGAFLPISRTARLLHDPRVLGKLFPATTSTLMGELARRGAGEALTGFGYGMLEHKGDIKGALQTAALFSVAGPAIGKGTEFALRGAIGAARGVARVGRAHLDTRTGMSPTAADIPIKRQVGSEFNVRVRNAAKLPKPKLAAKVLEMSQTDLLNHLAETRQDIPTKKLAAMSKDELRYLASKGAIGKQPGTTRVEAPGKEKTLEVEKFSEAGTENKIIDQLKAQIAHAERTRNWELHDKATKRLKEMQGTKEAPPAGERPGVLDMKPKKKPPLLLEYHPEKAEGRQTAGGEPGTEGIIGRTTAGGKPGTEGVIVPGPKQRRSPSRPGVKTKKELPVAKPLKAKKQPKPKLKKKKPIETPVEEAPKTPTTRLPKKPRVVISDALRDSEHYKVILDHLRGKPFTVPRKLAEITGQSRDNVRKMMRAAREELRGEGEMKDVEIDQSTIVGEEADVEQQLFQFSDEELAKIKGGERIKNYKGKKVDLYLHTQGLLRGEWKTDTDAGYSNNRKMGGGLAGGTQWGHIWTAVNRKGFIMSGKQPTYTKGEIAAKKWAEGNADVQGLGHKWSPHLFGKPVRRGKYKGVETMVEAPDRMTNYGINDPDYVRKLVRMGIMDFKLMRTWDRTPTGGRVKSGTKLGTLGDVFQHPLLRKVFAEILHVEIYANKMSPSTTAAIGRRYGAKLEGKGEGPDKNWFLMINQYSGHRQSGMTRMSPEFTDITPTSLPPKVKGDLKKWHTAAAETDPHVITWHDGRIMGTMIEEALHMLRVRRGRELGWIRTKEFEAYLREFAEVSAEKGVRQLLKSIIDGMATPSRAVFRREMRHAFELSMEESTQLFDHAIDAVAKFWAKENKSTPEAFYRKHIAAIEKGMESKAQGLDQLYSLATTPKWEKQFRRWSKGHDTEAKWLDDLLPEIGKLGALLNEHPELLQKEVPGTPLRSNSDIYVKTFDIDTNCPTRMKLGASVDAAQLRLGRLLTADEWFGMGRILESMGEQSSCLYCYVESLRRTAAHKLKKFADGNAAGHARYTKKFGVEYQTKGFDHRIWIDAKWRTRMAKKDPNILNIYKAGLEYGNAKINYMKPEYHPYSGDYLRLGKTTWEKIDNTGVGARFFSNTDFKIPHIIDLMQGIADLALMKKGAHAYTKEAAFVEIFAPSGIHINVSTFPVADGKGGFKANTNSGLSFTAARKYRAKFPNVGTMVVGGSRESIIWSLKQPWVDMVIPYHKSGANKQQMEAMNVTDFSRFEVEKWLDPSAHKALDPKTGKMKTADVEKLMYKDHKNNFDTYMKELKKRGLQSKFPEFLELVKDGSITKEQYMKLIYDAARIDPGKPLKPVKPIFDWERATFHTSRWQRKGGYSFKEKPGKSVDVFLKRIRNNEKLYQGDEIDPTQAHGMVEFAGDGRAIMRGLNSPNFTTAAHEFAHVFRRTLPERMNKVLNKWANIKDGQGWDVAAEERFANAFVRYLADGEVTFAKGATDTFKFKVKMAFSRFKGWIREIYTELKDSPIEEELAPELRKMFDEIFGKERFAPSVKSKYTGDMILLKGGSKLTFGIETTVHTGHSENYLTKKSTPVFKDGKATGYMLTKYPGSGRIWDVQSQTTNSKGQYSGMKTVVQGSKSEMKKYIADVLEGTRSAPTVDKEGTLLKAEIVASTQAEKDSTLWWSVGKDTQEQVLRLVSDDPKISIPELARKTGHSQSTVEHLRRIATQKLVETSNELTGPTGPTPQPKPKTGILAKKVAETKKAEARLKLWNEVPADVRTKVLDLIKADPDITLGSLAKEIGHSLYNAMKLRSMAKEILGIKPKPFSVPLHVKPKAMPSAMTDAVVKILTENPYFGIGRVAKQLGLTRAEAAQLIVMAKAKMHAAETIGSQVEFGEPRVSKVDERVQVVDVKSRGELDLKIVKDYRGTWQLVSTTGKFKGDRWHDAPRLAVEGHGTFSEMKKLAQRVAGKETVEYDAPTKLYQKHEDFRKDGDNRAEANKSLEEQLRGAAGANIYKAIRDNQAVNDAAHGGRSKDIHAPLDPIEPGTKRVFDSFVDWATRRQRDGSAGMFSEVGEGFKERFIPWHRLRGENKSFFRDAVEGLRQAMEIPRRSRRLAMDAMKGVIGDLKMREFEKLWVRIVAEDVVESMSRGESLPGKIQAEAHKFAEEMGTVRGDEGYMPNVTKYYTENLEQIRKEVTSNPRIEQQYQNHRRLMKAVQADLTARGKIKGTDARDFYFHHEILDFMEQSRSPVAIGKRLKTPARAYTKQRKGSEREYNTDYLDVTYRHLAQVFQDNMVDDAILRLAAAYARRVKKGEFDGETVKWQPMTGNAFYTAKTITDKKVLEAIEAAFGEASESMGLPKFTLQKVFFDGQGMPKQFDKVFKDALIVGGKRMSYDIPVELAYHLDNFKADNLWQPSRALSTWKHIMLNKNPFRYNRRNFVGDSERLLNAIPSIMTSPEGRSAINDALHDIVVFTRGKGGKMRRPEIFDLSADKGVTSGGEIAYEVGAIFDKVPEFRQLTDGKNPRHYFSKVNEWLRDVTTGREDFLRLAAFYYNMGRYAKGHAASGAKGVKYAGWERDLKTGISDIRGITNPADAAAKIARETLGDYGNFTNWENAKLRNFVLPFYSWLKINTTFWPMLITRQGVKTAGTGAALTLPIKAFRVAGVIAKATALYGAVTAWNNTQMREIEESLPDHVRRRFHIVLGGTKRNPIVFTDPTALSDFLDNIGIEGLPTSVIQLMRGQISVQDFKDTMIEDIAKAPIKKFMGLLNPVFKATSEVAVGYSLYPDPFNPRKVSGGFRERVQRAVGLGEFSPGRGLSRTTKQFYEPPFYGITGIREYDSRRSALYSSYETADDFLKGKGQERGSGKGPKTEANRDYFNAILDGDKELIKKLRRGMDMKSFRSYVEARDPMKWIKKEWRGEFNRGLNKKEKKALLEARKLIAWVKARYAPSSKGNSLVPSVKTSKLRISMPKVKTIGR